jgi:hypothetical protein
MLRRRRRTRTLSLPKPLALYLTFLHSKPLPPANTPITQISNRHQAHKHHQCTPHTANPLHPLHRSSPPRLTHSMGLHTHLHLPNPQAHRLFLHRLHLSLRSLIVSPAPKLAALSNRGQGRHRPQHLIRIPFHRTLMDKYAHNHLVPRTRGSASATSGRRSTRNTTTLSFQRLTKAEATRLLAPLRLEQWD